MAQTNITGLSRQAKYDFLIKSYSKQIIDVTKGYESFFNQLLGVGPESQKTFLDTVGDIASLPFTTIYSGIKGAFEGVVGMLQSVNLLLTSFVNDMARTFDESDGTDWKTDINYALTNLTTTVAEGAIVSGISLGANIAGLFGVDQNWAYGEDGLIDTVADLAMVNRAIAGKPQDLSLPVQAFGPNANLDAAADRARDIVDRRYYDATKQWIKGSIDVQNWVNKNLVIPPINEFVFGWAKNNTDAAFGDQTWYQGFKGTAESLGNILASWGVAKFAGKIGLSQTGQQLAASSYFAGSIFGNSFNEAYANGASIQDAYTYATGVALTETAIEQLGGFKPGEWAGESLFKFLTKPGTLRTILSEANQEGWEEVVSQFGGTGMSYYASGKNQVDQTQVRKGFEFLGDAFGAYLGGFASSLALGSGRAILTRNDLNTQVEGIRNLFDQDVTEFGEEKAIEQLNKRLEKLVTTLNKKNIRGIKFNKRGGTTSGVLTKAELAEMLNLSGLGRVITFEPTMLDPEAELPARPVEKALERGLGTFVLDKNKKITKDFFKNTMTVSEGGQKKQVVVQPNVFAHNKATKGIDLSDGGKVNPIGIDNTNEKGKKVLKLLENSKAPVVIYEGNPKESGYYNRKNGVIYINQNANIDINELTREALIHETVHLISKNAPGQFNEIKKYVNELVQIKLNKTKNGLDIEFKNKKVEKYFKDKKINLQKLITDSFNEMVLPESEGGQGLPIQRALLNIQEELVAYFVEAVVKEKSVLDLIKNTKVSLVERISNFFEERASRQEQFGGAAGSIGKVVSTLKTATEEGLSRAQSIKNYVDYAFGTDNFAGFIKSKILGKYSEEEVLEALINRQYDLEAQTITIKGEVLPISEVFNDKGPEGNLKRWVEKGTDLYKAGVLLFNKLSINKENVDSVIANVNKWIKTAEKKQTDPDTIEEDRKEIGKYIRLADLALEQLEKYKKSKGKEGFTFADTKNARGQEVKASQLKQSVAVALAELELNKKTKTQSPISEQVAVAVKATKVEVDPAVKAKQIERKEAAVNLLNRILKRFNFSENSAFPGWVRNVNTDKQEFYISLFKEVEMVEDTREEKRSLFDPYTVGKSRQEIEALTQQVVDIIAFEVARMYPPIKGPNGEDIVQFRVTHKGLSSSTYNGNNLNQYLKGVQIVVYPSQELLDLTVAEIAKKEEEANKTPEEKAIEQPKPIGERQKNFNLLLETSKGMVENLVNNVKTVLKEVGVAFEQVKVFTNTKGSDKGVFDTNVKDLGIKADNVEGVETDVKTSQTIVDDALGKNFRLFQSAYELFAQENGWDVEYNLMDAVGDQSTPFGTLTPEKYPDISGSVFYGMLYIWAEYLEFLQVFPEFQNKTYTEYFEYIKANPNWAQEARQKLNLPTTVGELRKQQEAPKLATNPMSEEEKNVLRDALGMNLERIKENKLSVNKVKALLPERYRDKFSTINLEDDGTYVIMVSENYEINNNPGEDLIPVKTDEEFISALESIVPFFANTPKVSLEKLQEISVKIDDELIDISAKIQEWFEQQRVKERPEDPNESSEIFQRNEDLIASIDSLQVFGIMVEGKEFSLFDELTAFLGENYVPVRIIDKVIDPISIISEFFSELSRIKEELSELAKKPQESINEGLLGQILNLEELKEKFDNAKSELEEIFGITDLKLENILPVVSTAKQTQGFDVISDEENQALAKVVEERSKNAPERVAGDFGPFGKAKPTFEEVLAIPEARELIDTIEGSPLGSDKRTEAKNLLKEKFGYDYVEEVKQDAFDAELEAYFQKQDEGSVDKGDDIVRLNQGYGFSDEQKRQFDKQYPVGTQIYEEFTKETYFAGGASRGAIRYVKQVLDKKIRSGEGVSMRTMMPIMKETGLTAENLAKVLSLLRDIEAQSKFETTLSGLKNYISYRTLTETQRIIPTFDKNNVVIGMPEANAESVQKAIEEAFKVSPIVAFVVPATWNKYKQQSVIPSNKKLIAWTANGLQKVITGQGQPTINVKTITQIWVDATDERFMEYEDLRAIDSIKTRTDAFYTTKTLAGVKETYQKLVEQGEEFDLILRSVGFNEQTDFNQKFTKLSEISPTQTYIAIKINDPQMKDTYLKYLNQIDYNELAKKAPTLRLGFTAEDIAQEFIRLVDASIKANDGKLKKITGMNINEEQRKRIRALFGENIVRDFFVVDKKGNLVLSNAAIAQRSYKQRAAKINGAVITAKVYAMNVLQDLTGKNFDLDDEDILVKNEELNEEEKKVIDFFKLLNINFVVYRSNKGRNAGGYTLAESGQTLVFINKSQLLKQPFINEVIIHEFLHQLFLFQPGPMMQFASSLADILINPDGTESDIFKQLTAKFGTTGFIDYLKKYARFNPAFKGIKSIQDIVNVLKDAKNNLDVANELVAQLGGLLFTDEKVFASLLGAGDNAKLFSFYNIYSSVINDTRIPKNLRNATKNLLNNISPIIDQRLKDIEKIYPKTRTYTLAELNNFISQFTNGQFTTKKQLIEASLEERANNKRGPASIALDNIIFASSLFARTVKTNADVFSALQNEFTVYRTSVEYILDNPEAILTGQKTKIFSLFKSIFTFPKIFDSAIKKANEAAANLTGPKVYYNEAEADADNASIYDLLPNTLIDNQIANIYDFLEQYELLDDNLLTIMGLPSKAEVNDMVEELIKAHEKTLDSMFQKGFRYKDSYTPALEKFKGMFGKQFAEAKTQFSKGSENTFKKLIDLQTKARKSKINLIATVMKNKLNATIQRIRSQPLQAQSPVNRNIKDLANLISQIVSILENQAFDSKTMLLEINGVMKQIVTFLNAQYVDKDGKSIGNVLDTEEAKSQFITSIVVIYKQLASLIGKELMDKNNKSDPYAILGENTQNNPFGMPLSINDLSVIGETFSNLTDPNFTPLRGFSEAQFAKQFANIIRLFETKYESSLGETPLTHNEYAAILAKEINAVDDAGGNIPNLKAAGLSLEKLSNVMLPQDFFRLMDTIFGQKGIRFFKDFFREYVKATLRRSDILQVFDIEYARWIKTHKENQKKSIREKVELDPTIIAQMPKGKLQKIDDEVKKEVEQTKEEQKVINKKIKELSVAIKGFTTKIKEYKEKLKRTANKDQARTILKNELAKLQDQKKKAMSIRISERLNKEKLQNRAKALNPVVLKKIKIREYIGQRLAKGEKIPQSISRGHLVSLYLSVVREQEMHDLIEAGMGEEIYPTNHFDFGNQFNILDNERLRKFGWVNARSNQVGFTIVAEDRKALIAYLQSLLSEEDLENIEFAKERFDANYEMLDEIFFQRYKVHLPRQETYIPFASSESDYKREFKLKQANRYNIAAPDGMVTATTSGAKTILRIENIFSVIENHTQDTANYSFERLITDWQNLFVNGSGGSTLQSVLTDGTVFGKENGILSTIENSLLAILQYNDITESFFTKIVKQVIRNTVAATMSLNLPSAAKQLASVSTIILKNGIQLVSMLKNVSKAMFLPSKYRRWLMGVNPTTGKPNNSNFYFRTKVGNVAALAEQLDTRRLSQLNSALNKVTNFLALPVGWTDNAVLVGAFASLVEKVQKENPNISEEEAFQRANVLFQEVLLYGVANTDSAFRSRYSNRRGALDQIVSRYQSENVMQVSALLADRILVKNEIKGGTKKFLRDMLAFLFSSIFASFINNILDQARGTVSQEDATFEFWVNELLMDNIIGAVPYLNIITNAVQFDPEKVIEVGIEPKLPVFNELYTSIDLVSQIINADTDPSRRIVKLSEVLGQAFGVPVRNVVRLSTDLVNTFAPKAAAVEVMNWYMSRTPAQGLTASVISGDKKAIEVYLDDKFNNTVVQNEIAKLLSSDSSLRLSLRNDDTFVYKGKTYEIPAYQKDKYNRFAQKALQKLIGKGAYRKLSNKDKIKAIQRIINYYSNYMRAVIAQDRDELNTLAAAEGIEDVLERALTFDENE